MHRTIGGGTPCDHQGRLAPRHEFGIPVNIDDDDADINSIQDCVDAYFEQEVPQFYCNTCASNGNHYFHPEIEAAPRILKVHLLIFTQEEVGKGNWVQNKNEHSFDSPDPLDLTQYQKHDFLPLRYRLSGVVVHEGDLDSGHYIATVKGQGDNCFRISDHQVECVTQNVLTRGPQRPREFWRGTRFHTCLDVSAGGRGVEQGAEEDDEVGGLI